MNDQALAFDSAVTLVTQTRVREGMAEEFGRWQSAISAAAAEFPGFITQSVFGAPPPRFDTEDNLQTWLESPERKELLEEAAPFLEEFHARVVRTGFEQWFPSADGASAPAAWKQNMIVLLLLYPVVFLFGAWVQTPILRGKAGLPFWLALFIGNVVSVLLLNWLLPWVSRGFGWWLAPARDPGIRTDLVGAMLVIVLYGVWLFLFSQI
jgi:antibiotic biosynthesis monooxygenase (ABM) superfamily enzyme